MTGADGETIQAMMLEHLRDVFDLTVKGTSLRDMTFKYADDRWKDHEYWPTLDKI